MYTLRYAFTATPAITIEAELLDDTGSVIQAATILSFFEISGSYGLTIRHQTQFTGFIGFYNASTHALVAMFSVNPQEAENTDIPSSQIGKGLPTPGGFLFNYTVVNYLNVPLNGVAVWITSDPDGVDVVAGTFYSDVNGHIECTLPSGTFYLWRRDPAWNFENPKAITV